LEAYYKGATGGGGLIFVPSVTYSVSIWDFDSLEGFCWVNYFGSLEGLLAESMGLVVAGGMGSVFLKILKSPSEDCSEEGFLSIL